MHRRKRISGKCRSRTRKATVRMLLITAPWSRTLMTKRTNLMRKLMTTTGHVVSTRITTSETRRIIKIIVLKFNKSTFARLGHRCTRCAVTTIATLGPGCHRSKPTVMKMLLHVRTTATAVTTAAAVTTASCGLSTTAGHTVRCRGARRTGVARPEWAPQVREVERRRAARTLQLCRDVDAAPGPCRRRRRADTARSPNLVCLTDEFRSTVWVFEFTSYFTSPQWFARLSRGPCRLFHSVAVFLFFFYVLTLDL